MLSESFEPVTEKLKKVPFRLFDVSPEPRLQNSFVSDYSIRISKVDCLARPDTQRGSNFLVSN